MAKVTRITLDDRGGLERRRLHLREISDDADSPLETVGQDLRAARQRKGEDLATVSKVLKIRKDHLEAIEESNMNGLPGRAYAIGFIRSYSEYLGLDAPAAIERFKAEIAGRGGSDDVATFSVPEERKLPQGSIVLVFVFLAVALYVGYYLAVSADRMLAEPVAPVPARLTQTQNPAPPPAAAATPAPAPAVAPPPPQPAPAATVQGPTPEDIAALPKGHELGIQNKDSRVELRFHKSTRVLVQASDNVVLLHGTMAPGDLYHAPNTVGLVLSIPDGNAVEIILDGTSMGFAGQSGVIAEGLSLNPQAIVDRHNAVPKKS